MKVMPARDVTHILIHNTASHWGNVPEVRRWHTLPPPKGNGWSDIGYHFLILNQYPTYYSWNKKVPSPSHNGLVQTGRPANMQGAHEQKYNHRSIGVCLVGNGPEYTEAQMRALKNTVKLLMATYNVPRENVLGHHEVDEMKRDPGFDMGAFRLSL